MESRELRIGNFIYKFGIDYVGDNPIVDRYDREIIKVDLSVLANIINYDGTTNFYYTEPIPLTEEILLKCGFRKLDKYTFVLNGYFVHKRNLWFVFNRGRYKVILNSLHELQNNYYYNNNKQELEINL